MVETERESAPARARRETDIYPDPLEHDNRERGWRGGEPSGNSYGGLNAGVAWQNGGKIYRMTGVDFSAGKGNRCREPLLLEIARPVPPGVASSSARACVWGDARGGSSLRVQTSDVRSRAVGRTICILRGYQCIFPAH